MDLATIDQTSEQFLGQWKRLVSTTNWEKGAIIHAWREALRSSGAPPAEYSDDAWARRVGHVTPQHVGRLRRAFERFGAVREDYPGLYWSHFQAALDWEDAEMWLEGAVQSDWSIADMRQKRFETLGGQPSDAAAEDDAAWDDDAEAANDSGEVAGGTLDLVRVPDRAATADDGDAGDSLDEGDEADDGYDAEEVSAEGPTRVAAEPFRPFANLASLPADVSDAFEAIKLAILRHKLAGWQEISRDDLLAALDALKDLALAPA